jgi:hypothetical protein
MTPFTVENVHTRYNDAQLFYRIVAPMQFEEQENFPINPENTQGMYKVPPGYSRVIHTSGGTIADNNQPVVLPMLKGMRPGQMIKKQTPRAEQPIISERQMPSKQPVLIDPQLSAKQPELPKQPEPEPPKPEPPKPKTPETIMNYKQNEG